MVAPIFQEDEITTYSHEELKNTILLPETKEFLVIGGLPKETAHASMTFNEKLYTSNVQSLKDQILLEGDYFAHYHVIGSVDNGWICVNSDADDQVLVLDVDYPSLVEYEQEASSDEYRGKWFMNSSVFQMAKCVLAYQKFFRESSVDDETAVKDLRENMREIDPVCMEKNAFWWYETQYDTLNGEV